MRELIKAEERLVFARHNAHRSLRKESAAHTRQSPHEPLLPARRILLNRKELY